MALRVTQAFLDAQAAGEEPITLAFLQSGMGRRVYGFITPTQQQMGSTGGLIQYDGSATVGGGSVFGSTALVLDWGPFLLNVGTVSESLTADGDNLLTSLSGTEIASLSAQFLNQDDHFSDILGDESFLAQTFLLRVGYPSLAYGDFLTLYTGTVIREAINELACEIDTEAV